MLESRLETPLNTENEQTKATDAKASEWGLSSGEALRRTGHRCHPVAEHFRCPQRFLESTPAIGEAPKEEVAVPEPQNLASRLDYLRLEQYCQKGVGGVSTPFAAENVRRLYYAFRPLLPDSLRRFLQRVYLSDWRKLTFPHWPVDTSVEDELEAALLRAMQASQIPEVPFVWFWPDGANAALMLTHDVETKKGLDFVRPLMDIDEEFGFKGAYQLVPEERYSVPARLIDEIHARGCEVNVHGLDHNGNLFGDHAAFLKKTARINHYVKSFRAIGFRSPCMYRNSVWLRHLDIQYDMSVPNVAHLEPQRGGCCTVFPYFIDDVLELPLTTIQDYSLMHMLKEYSIDLWREQIDLILGKHGLVSFIVHPDYLQEPNALLLYRQLLSYLRDLAAARNIWIARPGEINRWWRLRHGMVLNENDVGWAIAGNESGQASVAYVRIEGDRMCYRLASERSPS
jgi:hypothetical protein